MLMGGHSANAPKSTAAKAAATSGTSRGSLEAVSAGRHHAACGADPAADRHERQHVSAATQRRFPDSATGPQDRSRSDRASLGGTIGGTVTGGRAGSLSVTPEPTMWLLMITGVVALIVARRREKEVNS